MSVKLKIESSGIDRSERLCMYHDRAESAFAVKLTLWVHLVQIKMGRDINDVHELLSSGS